MSRSHLTLWPLLALSLNGCAPPSIPTPGQPPEGQEPEEALAAGRKQSASRAHSPPTLSTVTMGEFAYIGPGSMGKFVSYQRHPTLPDVLFAGADVGGIYLTTDDGLTWTNITRDLPANGVHAVGLVVDGEGEDQITRVVLGTDTGLYHSEDLATGAGLDAEDITGWTEVDGIDFGDERPDQQTMRALSQYNLSWKSMPIGVVTVDPSDPQIVWAGVAANAQVNLAQDPKDPYSLQRFDRWKLYRSLDGGLSFEPALRFSAPIADFVAPSYDSDGSIFSILVDPADSGRVLVASDRGLYVSENADTAEDADGDGLYDLVWSERGLATRRETTDLGQSWTDTAPGCEDWVEGSAALSWCLPIITNATVQLVLDPATGWPSPGYETHPNTRSLSISTVAGAERLYLSVWDRGHADDQSSSCSADDAADSFKDSTLTYTRGGIYVSDDGGESWRWLFTDTGEPGTATTATPLFTEARYRCDAETSERSSDADTTYVHEVQARPEADADFLMIGVLGSKSGLWRYDASDDDDPWLWLSDQGESTYDARFEGERPLNLSKGRKIEIQRMLVDWDEATDGWPRVEFGLRGMLRATRDSAAGWYTFEHLGSTYAGTLDGLPAWQGTGLDDAVVWDVQELGGELFIGVSDGAVLHAEAVDGVWTWTAPATETWTSNWSTDSTEFRKDETHSLAYDADRDILYATNVATATDYLYSVLAWDGASWTVVGGYGWPTDSSLAEEISEATMNGLYSGSPLGSIEMYDLVWVPSEAGSSIDLLLASSDGLWAYDAEAAADAQWSRLCEDRTARFSFQELELNLDLAPGYAFAVGENTRLGGLLAIDLSDGSCADLRTTRVYDPGTGLLRTDADPIRSPTAVALASDGAGGARLVVGAPEDGFATLFSGGLDCSAGCAVDTWSRAATVAGLYAEDDPRAPVLERWDITAIAVDPRDPSLLLAAIGTKPGYDYYNPEWMFGSEDGGQTATAIPFGDDDHGLPNRSQHMLEFSADGSTLYSGSRSSLFAMPVGW